MQSAEGPRRGISRILSQCTDHELFKQQIRYFLQKSHQMKQYQSRLDSSIRHLKTLQNDKSEEEHPTSNAEMAETTTCKIRRHGPNGITHSLMSCYIVCPDLQYYSNYNQMRYLLLAFILFVALQKQYKINYNHSSSSIQLYTQRRKPINLKLSFETSDLSLHQSLKGLPIFLEKNAKQKLQGLNLVKYNYKIRPGTIEDDSMGVVGLQQSNIFFEVLRKSLNSSQIKLQFKHKQGVINIIDQPCKYPLFAPLPITLSEVSTHTFTINSFSTNFYPDSSFLKLIGKSKNPFQMTTTEMNEEITISIRDKIISVPFKDIVSCGKYQKSNSYECQLKIGEKADVGGLLFNFDPIFCNSGVQLHKSIDDSWGFHYSHIILLILQFLLLIMLVKDEKILGILNKILKARKHH